MSALILELLPLHRQETDHSACFKMDDAAEAIIECPLCQSETNYIQTWHILLEEQYDSDVGTGQPIRRHYIDIIRFTAEQRSREVTVHDYCWAIVQWVFRNTFFDQAWIDEFKEHVEILRPFLTQVPFDEETTSLDLDIFAISKSGSSRGSLQERLDLPLPPEMIRMIFFSLQSEEDLISLGPFMSAKPSSEHWGYWAHKHMLANDLDPETNVTTLIQNLQRMPQERYPKTVNYRTTWDNIELLRKVMEKPTVWRELLDSSVEPQETTSHTFDLIRGLGEVPEDVYMSFIFDDEAAIQRLVGISFNGLLVGCDNRAWYSVHVNFLRGLRIASIGHDIVGVQVKDSVDWREHWYGVCLPESSLVHIEWQAHNAKLLVSHNVSRYT